MDRKCNIINCEDIISSIKPNITEEYLVNISNKGVFKRGSKDAESVTEAEISYSDETLTVRYDDITVSIKKDLKNTSCSCKSKTVCRHVITAFVIISECITETAESPADTSSNETVSTPNTETPEEKISINKEYLKEVTGYLDSVIKKGIINCGSTDIDISAQLSIKGENTAHNNISLMLRRFSENIKSMLIKSADFSYINTFHLICRIYNTAGAVLRNEENNEALKILCTNGRENYVRRETLIFYGLGAYPWISESGYAGITALLYCEDDCKIYTYSASIPYIHENTKKYSSYASISKLYNSHSHWRDSDSISRISKSAFRVSGCRTSSTYRLSSSKETIMNVLGANFYDKTALMDISAQNILNIKEEYSYFSEKRPERICTIKLESFGRYSYNKIRQVLEFEIHDDRYSYPCEIVWNEMNKKAVSYFEKVANEGINSKSFLVCRYYKGIFTPVSIIKNDGVKNFYFE